MSCNAASTRNWFDQGGRAYARFRPEYPPDLATFLASITPDRKMAVDVGCGNGQLTRLLAPHFDSVAGLDPSADQIANATPHERITYLRSPAERLPLANGCANLITVAQAAHWFNLPDFYTEARRIAAPGGILALISYGVLSFEPELNERFMQFYRDEIGPYWPPARKLVDAGYSTIDFPFEELAAPPLSIKVHWNLAEFLGYLATWSAVRRAKEAGHQEVPLNFASDLSSAWGDENVRRNIVWPLNMRIGRL
ncbi:MAG TPA: class I SAM-dependent methyltransferase [Castellaniella sp.]|uniref:class I SAM-dependent methyltransferase n=1 Tax=Castellaniella sp. TaxID=1955812 RepID=UPI002EF90DB0